MVRLSSRSAAGVARAARALAERARPLLAAAGAAGKGFAVLGPAPAPIARIRGAFRWQLLIKARRRADLRALLDELLAAGTRLPGADAGVDVDPESML